MNNNLNNNFNDNQNSGFTTSAGMQNPSYAGFLAQKKKAKPLANVEFNKKDFISFLVTTVIMFLVSYIGIINFFNFGFTVTMLLFTVFAFFYLFNKNSKNKIFNLFLFVSSILLITSFSLNSDGLIKFISILYLMFLLVVSFTGVSNNILQSDSNYFWIFESFFKPVKNAFENIFSPFKSAKSSMKNEKGKNITSVLIGILVAVPALFIIVPLLSSSDIAFESVINKIFENTNLIFTALLITVLLTPCFYSLIFYLKKAPGLEQEKLKKHNGKLTAIGMNSFLISISIVYLFYIFTQLAYIVDAFSFVLPEDYTAAEFARSGFFQMAVIVFINFVILGFTAINIKRNNFKLPKSTKGILIFISAFTIFYISTAIIKMAKYISIYGLTRLRVLTTVFMLMLAMIFVIIILKLLISKLKYIKPIIVVCTLTLLAISLVDINTVIAEYNYREYKAGKIQIDVEQIDSLGISGVPTLSKLVDEKDYDVSFKAKEALMYSNGDIYFRPFSVDPKEITPAKDNLFEYNLIWINSKEAFDSFTKKHPQFNEETFEAEYNKYYEIEEIYDADSDGLY